MLDALQKSAHKLRALSMHDPLTGLWNRRQFTEMALREIRVSGRYGHRLALGMADIDHFKTINDTYGHDFGDMLIISACRLICKTFQHSPVYRIGGDEFVVILEKSDFDHYPELLEKLQKEIDGYNRNARADTQVSPTSSNARTTPCIKTKPP